MQVDVIGAGLAGCEAALWLADAGVQVDLYEQKPGKFSPAHKSAGFAELICSNSLKAERPDSASGLLKLEMKMMGSHLLQAAETARVAAGGALAVDRDVFSAAVTEMVEKHPNITVHREEVTALDESAPVLVASGPLTEGALADAVAGLTGDHRLSFFDAVAPIVTAESLDARRSTILTAISPSTRAACPSRSWLPAGLIRSALARCARWACGTPAPGTALGRLCSCAPRTPPARCTTSSASRRTSNGVSRSGCSV